jgi:hypothetical protein
MVEGEKGRDRKKIKEHSRRDLIKGAKSKK